MGPVDSGRCIGGHSRWGAAVSMVASPSWTQWVFRFLKKSRNFTYIYIYLSISLLSQEISPFLNSLNTYIIEVELKGISRVCVLTGCWLVGWGSEFSCPERLHWVSTWSPGRVGLACRLPWSLDRHSGAIWFFLGCYQDIYIYIYKCLWSRIWRWKVEI